MLRPRFVGPLDKALDGKWFKKRVWLECHRGLSGTVLAREIQCSLSTSQPWRWPMLKALFLMIVVNNNFAARLVQRFSRRTA